MDIHAVLPWGQIAAAIGAPLLIAWATRSSAAAATHQAHQLDRDRRAEAASEELEAVLWGIHAEIDAAMQRYWGTIGNELQEERDVDQPFGAYLVAQQPYFSLYEQSASVLGRMSDTDLLQSIVNAYTLLRAMVDAHVIQREIVTAPSGERGGDWRSRSKQHKMHLIDVHDRLWAATDDVLARLEHRHGALYQADARSETSAN